MKKHEKINYVEFPAKDIAAAKSFDGGFFKSDLTVSAENGSALIVFYSRELENTQTKIENAGGSIIKPIFPFPGGRRFHFSDTNGNEYAVWSDIAA